LKKQADYDNMTGLGGDEVVAESVEVRQMTEQRCWFGKVVK
jgi:hypothetical protein